MKKLPVKSAIADKQGVARHYGSPRADPARTVSWGVVAGVVAVTACTHLQTFRSKAPEPTPAASPGELERHRPLGYPFGFADNDDFVVRVLAEEVTCSGTLIERDRVLTAHHCVAARAEDGSLTGENVEPEKIRVELGGDYLPWGEVGVRHVVTPPCGGGAGKGDIAILMLEQQVVGMARLPPELGRPPKLGENIEPIGFGRCALSRDGIRRRKRAGGAIERVESGRFLLSASICPGDSGGPALSDVGELLGVISASVMDGSAQTRGPSEFIRLDRWRSVFATAKLVSDGVDPLEIPPIDCVDP